MADEYISKQAFNDAIREAVRMCPTTFYNGLEVARQIAHNMDAADVAPARHGRWIVERDDYFGFSSVEIKCSECNSHPKDDEMTSFCPNCGARMDMGTDCTPVKDGDGE